MKTFVRVVSVAVLFCSSVALALGIVELAIGDSSEQAQAGVVMASALFGELVAGVSWLMVDIADALGAKPKPLP